MITITLFLGGPWNNKLYPIPDKDNHYQVFIEPPIVVSRAELESAYLPMNDTFLYKRFRFSSSDGESFKDIMVPNTWRDTRVEEALKWHLFDEWMKRK